METGWCQVISNMTKPSKGNEKTRAGKSVRNKKMKKLAVMFLSSIIILASCGCGRSIGILEGGSLYSEMENEYNVETTATDTVQEFKAEAKDLIGLHVSDLVHMWGDHYVCGYDQGRNYILFPDQSVTAFTDVLADGFYPDATVCYVVCSGSFPVIDQKQAGMTYSELLVAFPEAAGVELSREKNEMDGYYGASVQFVHGEYLMRCEWNEEDEYPDINYNKCTMSIAPRDTGFYSAANNTGE